MDSTSPHTGTTTTMSPSSTPALDALRVSEERYRLLAEIATDYAYVWRVTESGSLESEWFSSSYANMMAYSTQEVAEKGWRVLVHPEDTRGGECGRGIRRLCGG